MSLDAMAGPDAFDSLFGEESEEWPEHQTSRGFHAPWLATLLLALLLVSGGLWLGALLQRHENSGGSANLSPTTNHTFTPGGTVTFRVAPAGAKP